MVKNGCAFGRETKQIVLAIKEDFKEMKVDIKNLSNHYSNRLPHWATVIITLLTSVSVGLIVNTIK